MFFFFKQKTAYELRISDWSSDVCSSDLTFGRQRAAEHRLALELADVALRLKNRDVKVKQVAGFHRLAELHAVDAHEIDEFDGAGEAERFDRQHAPRSEERRGGKECVSTCRSRLSP